jgi:hypothetical protein
MCGLSKHIPCCKSETIYAPGSGWVVWEKEWKSRDFSEVSIHGRWVRTALFHLESVLCHGLRRLRRSGNGVEESSITCQVHQKWLHWYPRTGYTWLDVSFILSPISEFQVWIPISTLCPKNGCSILRSFTDLPVNVRIRHQWLFQSVQFVIWVNSTKVDTSSTLCDGGGGGGIFRDHKHVNRLIAIRIFYFLILNTTTWRGTSTFSIISR